MAKKQIILIRHGQSEANQDLNILLKKPDYACLLTELGHQQAEDAGKEIAKIISGPAHFFVSPYWRTRQTYLGVRKNVSQAGFREDPRIREQEWKTRLSFDLGIETDRDAYGPFYYRVESGESCADCYSRAAEFLTFAEREFEREDSPQDFIFVSHGMFCRILLMVMLGLTVEEFEILRNFKNCQYHILEYENGKYTLKTELQKHDKHLHEYQFPWP